MIRATATLLALLLASCANSGIDGEPDATDTPTETEPFCGNAIVEEGEECDGGDEPCPGPECPGIRECLDDCTLGECVSGTFGIMAGPTLVNEDVWLDEIKRIDLAWDGSRYGVFYAGHRIDPLTPTWTAYFTPVSIHAEVAGPANQILPDLYLIEEVQAEWNPSAGNYCLLLVTWSVDDNLIANLADADGNVVHDIGILLTSEGEAIHGRLVLGEDGYGMTWQMGPRAAGFARLSEELVVLDSLNLENDDSTLAYRVPLLGTHGGTYHVLSHVYASPHRPSDASYELATLQFGDGPTLTRDAPFAGTSPNHPADMVMTGSLDLVVFARGMEGAPIRPVFLGLYDGEGGIDETLEIAEVGMRASAAYDVSLVAHDDEVGVALASADLDDPTADRELVVLRLDLDGSPVGPTFNVPVEWDVSMPSIVWDGEAYAIAYAVDRVGGEANVDVELVRVGCQLP